MAEFVKLNKNQAQPSSVTLSNRFYLPRPSHVVYCNSPVMEIGAPCLSITSIFATPMASCRMRRALTFPICTPCTGRPFGACANSLQMAARPSQWSSRSPTCTGRSFSDCRSRTLTTSVWRPRAPARSSTEGGIADQIAVLEALRALSWHKRPRAPLRPDRCRARAGVGAGLSST